MHCWPFNMCRVGSLDALHAMRHVQHNKSYKIWSITIFLHTSLLTEHSDPDAKLPVSSEATRCRDEEAMAMSPPYRGVKAPLQTLARSLSRR